MATIRLVVDDTEVELVSPVVVETEVVVLVAVELPEGTTISKFKFSIAFRSAATSARVKTRLGANFPLSP